MSRWMHSIRSSQLSSQLTIVLVQSICQLKLVEVQHENVVAQEEEEEKDSERELLPKYFKERRRYNQLNKKPAALAPWTKSTRIVKGQLCAYTSLPGMLYAISNRFKLRAKFEPRCAFQQ